MRLPGPRPRRAEAPHGLAAAARASGRFPALPENADRELPRPPREVAFLIREPERRSGALTVRISTGEHNTTGAASDASSGASQADIYRRDCQLRRGNLQLRRSFLPQTPGAIQRRGRVG